MYKLSDEECNKVISNKLEILISIYEDEDDEIGKTEPFLIANTSTIKDLVRQLAKKYKANIRDFNLEDTNTSKVLNKINCFDFDFYNRKGDLFAAFFQRN